MILNNVTKMYSLVLRERRLKLMELLRKEGFYVRLHAYEYLLGYNHQLKGLLLLEPFNGNIFLKIFGEKESKIIDKVKKCVYSIDKKISFYIMD